MTGKARTRRKFSWPRSYALLAGLVYLVLGLAGFVFAVNGELGIFGAGILMNLVHVVIGAFGLLTALKSDAPQAYVWAVFVALAGFTAFGLLQMATGNATDVNDVLVLHPADNWLHGATAVLGLVVGVLAVRREPADDGQ